MSCHLASLRLLFYSLLLCCSTFAVRAQTNPVSASCVRSYLNDIPNQPLISVSVTGAVGVACLTIEETLPVSISPLSISGDGVYVPALNAIRWGPYFNTVATNVSYRLPALPGSYPVSGGSWMDGRWFYTPGVTMVSVLPSASAGPLPSAPSQVASPVFSPASGTNVPVSVTLTDATPGAQIYYTLDGSLPTSGSTLYTGAVALVSSSVVRAVAVTNGWTPSVAVVAYYGSFGVATNVLVTRNVIGNASVSPMVTFTVTPGTNARCVALTETLPVGLSVVNLTAGGNYIATNNTIVWGPFLGTNVQTLSYQITGPAGAYPVAAAWSVDGRGGSETTGTNLVIALTATNTVPLSPLSVATPVISPPSGSGVPTNVLISCSTPGALIYYTLDGTLPTSGSALYSGAISVLNPSVVRAVALTNGWTPSAAVVAYYGSFGLTNNMQSVTRVLSGNNSASPLVTFTVTPGTNARCVAVTESLSTGLSVFNITAGGSYQASNNVIVWGPFFGTNVQTLSYQVSAQPGIYPVRTAWSVDGVDGAEMTGTNLVITGTVNSLISSPPQQVPAPVLTPALSSNLPVQVAITCGDGQAQIYYTTDGTLPTQSSTPYVAPLNFSTQTSLRALAFHSGYVPSVAVSGEYVPLVTTNTVSVTHNITGNASFLPTVSLLASPGAGVNCYAVVETIPFGLVPSGLSGDGIWDSFASVIRWGPYLDHQPRVLSYNIAGLSGTYPLSALVSFNGYSLSPTDVASVQVNSSYSGSGAVTNLAACASDYLTYYLNVNPSPGVVTVTSATGTINWGDGTQTAITQPVMTLPKTYTSAATYPIVVTANWSGYVTATAMPVSGTAMRTDSVQVVTSCLAPQIVTQPSNQVALAGSTVQFMVSAASSAPMTYQWYFNTNIPIYSPSSFGTLTLPNIAPSSAGYYSVVISNAFGGVTSSVPRLIVVTPLINSIVTGSNGQVVLNFAGLPNASTRIWATTNLVPPVTWLAIYTNSTTPTNGLWQFVDTNGAGFPVRFYRFSTP